MNFVIEEVHISEIRPGNTVEHNGVVHTVGRDNIKTGFMGRTLYGDSYRLGTALVKRLQIQQSRPSFATPPQGKAGGHQA